MGLGSAELRALTQKTNPSRPKHRLVLMLPAMRLQASGCSVLAVSLAVQKRGGCLCRRDLLRWYSLKGSGVAGAQHCRLTACFSFPPGLPISTYAKYCYRKLQKVAVTGGKKVSSCPSSGALAAGCLPGTLLPRSQSSQSHDCQKSPLIQ